MLQQPIKKQRILQQPIKKQKILQQPIKKQKILQQPIKEQKMLPISITLKYAVFTYSPLLRQTCCLMDSLFQDIHDQTINV